MFRFGLSVLFSLLLGALVMGCGDSSSSKGGPTTAPVGSSFQVTTTSLPGATVGNPVDVSLTAANGAAPFTWTVRSGTLPPGVMLGTDGRLMGTPNTDGTFNFQVEVMEGSGLRAQRDLSMAVSPASSGAPVDFMPGSPFPDGTVGVAYNLDLKTKITGGTAPFTFSVVSGSLPPGISLSSDGLVTGTPGSAGTFAVTLQVQANGSVAQKGTNFTVN